MNDFLAAVFFSIVTGICLVALFSVLNGLFPTRVERIRHAAEAAHLRAFFLGLVNFLFFGAVFLGFAALGENVQRIFTIPALFILILISIGLTFGLAGVVQLTGDRLFPDRTPLQRIGWGTTALYLASLTPFVGWFGIMIYIAFLSLGAFILSFFIPSPSRIESE